MNCPVCDHPGLPDYHSVPSVCPNCKSDLKGFILIGEVEKESESKFKRLKLIFAGVTLVLLLLILGSFFFLPAASKHKPDKPELKNDSTEYYRSLVDGLKQEMQAKPATADIYYIIRSGDNLSKIAKLYYNNGSRINQIKTDNNLQKGYNLLPGDTLIIKIKTK